MLDDGLFVDGVVAGFCYQFYVSGDGVGGVG